MQSLSLERPIFRDVTLVILASFLICLSGQIAIPLWFTPVPIATQNSCVLLMAALLGSRRGAAATFAFLAQGALGLPVFSSGLIGVYAFFGPTGGYLIGYLVAAFVVGYMVERKKTVANCLLALSVGNAIILGLGAGQLSIFVGLDKAFALGVAPFLIGDFLKALATLKILQWSFSKKN